MPCPAGPCSKAANYTPTPRRQRPHPRLSPLPEPSRFIDCGFRSFGGGYLDVFHPGVAEAVQREAVPHARVQAVVRRVQQHVGPADRVVVPPGVEARELGQGGPGLGQEGAGFRAHFLPLPLAPGMLLGLVQGVQGVGVVDVGVGVLALVVGERLVGGREVGRLEVGRRGVGQRRGARVRSLGHRAQLGEPRAVARDAIVPVLGAERKGERGKTGGRRKKEREGGKKYKRHMENRLQCVLPGTGEAGVSNLRCQVASAGQ